MQRAGFFEWQHVFANRRLRLARPNIPPQLGEQAKWKSMPFCRTVALTVAYVENGKQKKTQISQFLRLRMFFRFSCFLVATFLFASTSPADDTYIWLGTGGRKPSKGIYVAKLNSKSGKLNESQLVAEIDQPGFLTFHPTKDILYAVGTPTGGKPSVVAYDIQRKPNAVSLKQINAQPIGDGAACHLSVDPTGRMLVTAQYGGGSVAAFGLNDDGSIAQRTELIDHEGGSNVVAKRQTKSHAHYAGFSPDNQFVLVPDLGLDRVVIYQADVASTRLTTHGQGIVPPGAGPRHMKFHPNAKWIYVLNELALSVTVFDWNAAGTMTAKQTIQTISDEEKSRLKFKSASEVRVHPNGKFLYTANRGHDTISVFSIDQDTGKLTKIEHEPIRGATPRNFNLSPDGKWLLAAGQDSNTLAVFAVDPATGKLTYYRSIISTPTPICVLFDRQ
jgi:6-phosphogluconolactonase